MKAASYLRTFAIVAPFLVSCEPRPSAATPATVTLNVAAASDLKFAMDEFVKEFRSEHLDLDIKVTYGSSGSFFAQLQNGAPFDLYFAADIDFPRKLAEAGLALDNDVFHYAVGHLVLWVPEKSPVDVERLGVAALVDPSVKKIAVANPKQAPYGRAAIAALESLKVYDQVESKLVYGENISQTAQFVQSGAADIGILALSLALAPEIKAQGRYWPVPLEAHPPLDQGGMILHWTKHPDAARTFRDTLLGEAGRALLRRYGFAIPPRK